MRLRRIGNKAWNILRGMSSRRKKELNHDHLLRPRLHATTECMRNRWLRKLHVRGLDSHEAIAASITNITHNTVEQVVGFLHTATMIDDDHGFAIEGVHDGGTAGLCGSACCRVREFFEPVAHERTPIRLAIVPCLCKSHAQQVLQDTVC